MNKNELISAVALKADMTKKDSEHFIASFIDVISSALKDGDKISISGFGTFEVKERSAREGINPQTKEKIQIAASKAPAFKAAKNLKDLLN